MLLSPPIPALAADAKLRTLSYLEIPAWGEDLSCTYPQDFPQSLAYSSPCSSFKGKKEAQAEGTEGNP